MYNNVQKAVIILFLLFYIILNLNHNKYNNILLFLVYLILTMIFIKNKYTALITAYLISIIFSIIQNIHLFEPYENNTISNLDNKISKISDKLLEKYINKLKIENPRLVSTRQVKVDELIPTKNELIPEKVTEMKTKEDLENLPIVINDDNFIIDGHYRWYINKNKNNKFIVAIIIKKELKDFYRDIKEFKIENNADEFKKFSIDKEKIMNAKKSIDIIMSNINSLNESMKDLDKINVV